MCEVGIIVITLSRDLSQPELDGIPQPSQPTHNMSPPPHITTQMKEFKTIIFDRIYDLVSKRLITSNLVTYVAN